jgi:hypothetical protein
VCGRNVNPSWTRRIRDGVRPPDAAAHDGWRRGQARRAAARQADADRRSRGAAPRTRRGVRRRARRERTRGSADRCAPGPGDRRSSTDAAGAVREPGRRAPGALRRPRAAWGRARQDGVGVRRRLRRRAHPRGAAGGGARRGRLRPGQRHPFPARALRPDEHRRSGAARPRAGPRGPAARRRGDAAGQGLARPRRPGAGGAGRRDGRAGGPRRADRHGAVADPGPGGRGPGAVLSRGQRRRPEVAPERRPQGDGGDQWLARRSLEELLRRLRRDRHRRQQAQERRVLHLPDRG